MSAAFLWIISLLPFDRAFDSLSLVQGVKPSSKLSHALATALVSCHALKPSLGLMSEYAEQGFPQTEFVAGVFIKVACRNKARFVVAMR